MGKNDRKHFERYRHQTEVKHLIVERYLAAFFTIMRVKQKHNELIYIDGFAGRGSYSSEDGETIDGSPIRALKLIAENKFLNDVVSCVFIEKDTVLAAQLKQSVDKTFSQYPQLKKEPKVRAESFTERLNIVLDWADKPAHKLPPSFLFVDPCGVDGVHFSTLQRFMGHNECELLLFFNLDGIKRILGLGDDMGDTLPNLLGSRERAKELLSIKDGCLTPRQSEDAIVDFFEELIRTEIGAKYVVSFRVEHETDKKASHYLIHATRHPVGFRIMKDVMWKVGRTDEGLGAMELQQASIQGQMLFHPHRDAIKAHILKELENGPQAVKYFTHTLVERPDNGLSTQAYTTHIQELEDAGKVLILDKDGSGELARKRQRMKNSEKLSLGVNNFVALPKY